MRRVVEIRYPIFDLTRSTNTGGERQTRRKVAALSRLLLFDDVGITGAARAEQPFNT